MDNYFIAGSNVLKYWGVSGIEPKDLDVFYIQGTKKPEINPSISNGLKIEYHTMPKRLFDMFITNNTGRDSGTKRQTTYLTLESLYILKLSHADYNIHWQKTINHIQLIKKYLRARGHKDPILNNLPKEYKELLKELKDFWEITHKKKQHIKLNVPKAKFFTAAVDRKYDHDYLHEAVMYYNSPMYKRCLKDGQEVLLDKKKFDALSFEEKLRLCREEIYVIALERYLIPNDFKMCEHEAYRSALRRLVTTMTRGWFPTFIVDNYNSLYKMDLNYMKAFKGKVDYDRRNSTAI